MKFPRLVLSSHCFLSSNPEHVFSRIFNKIIKGSYQQVLLGEKILSENRSSVVFTNIMTLWIAPAHCSKKKTESECCLSPWLSRVHSWINKYSLRRIDFGKMKRQRRKHLGDSVRRLNETVMLNVELEKKKLCWRLEAAFISLELNSAAHHTTLISQTRVICHLTRSRSPRFARNWGNTGAGVARVQTGRDTTNSSKRTR